MNTSKKNFSSKLVELSEVILRNDLAALKNPIMPVNNIKLSLCVVEEKKRSSLSDTKLQTNRFFDIKTDEEGHNELQSGEDFDTLVDYVFTAYNDFCASILRYCGTKGDTVALEAKIDKTFAFVDDEFCVSLSIPIPNAYKQNNNWITHIISNSNHKPLSKLHANFEGFGVQVREHAVQSITFVFKFFIGQKEQTVKHFFEATNAPILLHDSTSENEIRAFWMSAFNDIEKKVRETNQHSQELLFKMVEIKEEDFSSLALTLVKQKIRIKL